MKKYVWMAVIGLFLIAAIGIGYNMLKKEDKPLTPEMASTVVRKGNLEVKVSGTGSTQAAVKKSVSADQAGTVQKVHFEAGDTVKKGEVLISLEGQDMEDKIRSEELNLQKKRIDLEDLQTKIKSAEDESARDNLLVSYEKQKLDIESSRKLIADYKEDKEPSVIVSPIGGVLLSVNVEVGSTVNPNAVVAEVADYSELQLVVGIDELDIPKVKAGQDAQVTIEALPEQTFFGKVTKIADEGVTTNGVATFDVTIGLTTTEGIKAGMSAEASILVESKTDVLVLPIEAVQSFRNRYFVMAPATAEKSDDQKTSQMQPNGENKPTARGQRDDGAASDMETRKEITVGIHNEDFIEVVAGLNEGDQVYLPTIVSDNTNSQMQGPGGFPGIGVRATGGGEFRQFNGNGGGGGSFQRGGGGGK